MLKQRQVRRVLEIVAYVALVVVHQDPACLDQASTKEKALE